MLTRYEDGERNMLRDVALAEAENFVRLPYVQSAFRS
jgi:hypothetical protein